MLTAIGIVLILVFLVYAYAVVSRAFR